MKTSRWRRALAAGAVVLGMAGNARAAEIFKSDDVTVDIGARFQTLGDIEYVNDTVRDKVRVFLFQVENRLKLSGNFGGTKFHLEEALGGEAVNSSNNQINLLEAFAEVPVLDDALLSVVVGQFKLPTNLSSASYEENLLFARKSQILQMFFNQGYDLGIAVKSTGSLYDGLLGIVAGAPDMPQRYLNEFFTLPPILIARAGAGNIKDDPFHPKQEGYEKTEGVQWAVHINGMGGKDSNAGHSTLLSLQGGYATTFVANGYYSNVMLNSNWNPYLGKTAVGVDANGNTTAYGRVDAYYWTAGIDGQLRIPVGDLWLTLQGQANWSQFAAQNFAPIVMTTKNGTKTRTSGQLNIGGGELLASLGGDKYSASARFDVVVPDSVFQYRSGAGTGPSPYYYNELTGSAPIYEITFPSFMVHVNKYVKVVAETNFVLNAPEVMDSDGIYELSDMPAEASIASKTNPVRHANVVSMGRMLFQFAF